MHFKSGFPSLENLVSGEFERDSERDRDADGDLLTGLANKDDGRSRDLDCLSERGNGRAKVWSKGGLEEPSATEIDPQGQRPSATHTDVIVTSLV